MKKDDEITDEDREGDDVIETYRPGENITVIEEPIPKPVEPVDPPYPV